MRTAQQSSQRKTVSLFDFDCSCFNVYLDISATLNGTVHACINSM